MKKTFFVIVASLLLSGCTISSIVNTVTNRNAPADNQALSVKKLDLSNQQLKKMPEYVLNQTNLEELNLSNNQITGALQAEIRKLQNLKVLDASNNQMTGVPAEIGQLQNLQILNLSNNQLTGLPNELGNLKNLKTLNLSGNSYSASDLKTIEEKLPASVNIIK